MKITNDDNTKRYLHVHSNPWRRDGGNVNQNGNLAVRKEYKGKWKDGNHKNEHEKNSNRSRVLACIERIKSNMNVPFARSSVMDG